MLHTDFAASHHWCCHATLRSRGLHLFNLDVRPLLQCNSKKSVWQQGALTIDRKPFGLLIFPHWFLVYKEKSLLTHLWQIWSLSDYCLDEIELLSGQKNTVPSPLWGWCDLLTSFCFSRLELCCAAVPVYDYSVRFNCVLSVTKRHLWTNVSLHVHSVRPTWNTPVLSCTKILLGFNKKMKPCQRSC